MFDKFGEMNSYKEINELAENLFNEGDIDSLKIMAEENGIDQEVVKMYLDCVILELCTPLDAALGKIEVECKELNPKEIMQDWVEYLKSQCMDNAEMSLKVREKGKTVKGCIAALLKWSFGNQQNIDKEILNAAGVSAGRVTLGIPGMGRAKKIIKEYYLEK